MTWQNSFIETLGAFAKLVYLESQHGSCPPFSIVTEMVITERNRLIVQGNERLKRIQELEGALHKERLYSADVEYQIGECLKALNAKDDSIDALVEYIDTLISG